MPFEILDNDEGKPWFTILTSHNGWSSEEQAALVSGLLTELHTHHAFPNVLILSSDFTLMVVKRIIKKEFRHDLAYGWDSPKLPFKVNRYRRH